MITQLGPYELQEQVRIRKLQKEVNFYIVSSHEHFT